MAVNVREAEQRIMNQNWRKKISETKQHPRSQGLVLQLHRPVMTMLREDWADHMKHTYGKYCQRALRVSLAVFVLIL